MIIKTDAPQYVSAGLLCQYHNERVLHLLVYCSTKHTPANCNHDGSDEKLVAIIEALEKCRSGCEWAAYLLLLLTDYKNLECNITQKPVN